MSWGWRGCKHTTKSLDLVNIRAKSFKIRAKSVEIWTKYVKTFAKSLKIRAKMAIDVFWFEKIGPKTTWRRFFVLFFWKSFLLWILSGKFGEIIIRTPKILLTTPPLLVVMWVAKVEISFAAGEECGLCWYYCGIWIPQRCWQLALYFEFSASFASELCNSSKTHTTSAQALTLKFQSVECHCLPFRMMTYFYSFNSNNLFQVLKNSHHHWK